MPVAQPNNIPTICDEIKRLKPKRILDVGCGFGMNGFLARIYTVLWREDLTVEIYKNWKNENTIDAIEVYEPWVQELQKFIYNTIYIGDVREKIREVGEYDLILFGDVLEHLEKKDGEEVLRIAREKAKTVIVSLPIGYNEGKEKGGNTWEKHQAEWNDNDFKEARLIKNQGYQVAIYDRNNNA